jgi:hypothetical protein
MILGMTTLTFVHVVLSLIGIASGLVVVIGLLGGKRLIGWATVFLASAVLTSVTGFFFPFHKLLPSHVLGIISLVALALAMVALYTLGLAAVWRRIYAISAVLALYLNVFVLIAQLFQKVPALNALAPTGSEPTFLAVQLFVLLTFVAIGVLATKRFQTQSVGTT